MTTSRPTGSHHRASQGAITTRGLRISYPEDLPVSARRDDIMAAIQANQVVVIAGETGSGKTTQLPKMCLELGRGQKAMIGHTQPRRLAARTVAERLAQELGVALGGAIGYAVRFDDTLSDLTQVKVMTDGILLAEIRRDRMLRAYDTIIIDEAHERSLNIDFLLGYLTGLLPRRRDLKLIVTSATIDTARFAEHFDAPVVEVSGRTYPVEIRYRPLGETDDADAPDTDAPDIDRTGVGRGNKDRDINQAICDAVDELISDTPGDILVFLPGERDIRDVAGALTQSGSGRFASGTVEILPLYARLSAAEQHRAFRPHQGRRIVLATNVAETSLTVPGVRSVIDTGLARVSRFSHRTKVQRLPIEPVSQASANQRAGRCGRVAPGVCIRLYSKGDYLSRPDFTDPEILRTNLASVILQMAAIGLGEVEDFPFIQPPDRRAIAAGRALLEEIGAFERTAEGLRLTRVGRRIADLPLDPRFGRMVVEAQELGCLREVTVIAAAMTVADPRERPEAEAAAADELHRRFAVPDSDFLASVRLWDYLAEIQAGMSGNQFRKRCRAEYLNPLRIREWQDVAGQVRRACRSMGIHANTEPAPADLVHKALLAGLLSHIGMKNRVSGDYTGARSSRWQIARGSSLSARQAAWVVAGELVETGRTWARTVARIEPSWAEVAGAHLIQRSFSEPWWDPERGEAMTDERATLYGLPIVENRRATLARLDPVEARRMFIERALVERDWATTIPPLQRTEEKMAQISAAGERARRSDLLAGPEARFEIYDKVVPAGVAGGRAFLKWWRRAERSDPGALDVPLAALLDRSGGPIDLAAHPDEWRQGDLRLRLRYRYRPGAPDDGVTVVLPLPLLNRISPDGFDWNVAGYREELVASLVRLLPRQQRRHLGPAAEVARQVLASAGQPQGPQGGPLLATVAAALSAMSGEAISAHSWAIDDLPPHLRVAFEVVDAGDRLVARSHELADLKSRLRPRVREAIAAAFAGLERRGETTWVFDDIPPVVGRDDGLVAYPALVDEGSSVALEVQESRDAQARSMWAGTRRLILLAAPLPFSHLERRLTNSAKRSLRGSSMRFEELFEDCACAVVDQLIVRHGGPPFERAAFEEMSEEASRDMADRVARVASIAGAVVSAAATVENRVDLLADGPVAAAVGDLRGQLKDLVYPGFVSDHGIARLRHLLRYLDAAGRRAALLPGDARRDRRRQDVVDRVSDRYQRALDDAVRSGAVTAALSEVRWSIEELRVSLWAQALGTPNPVSEARIMRSLDRVDP